MHKGRWPAEALTVTSRVHRRSAVTPLWICRISLSERINSMLEVNQTRVIWRGAVVLLIPVCGWAQTTGGVSKKSGQVPELNQKVVKFCIANLGKKVDNGECAQLVTLAFREVGAKAWSELPAPKPPMQEDDYVWGRLLNPEKEAIIPGDILQLRDVEIKIVYPNRSWRTWSYSHHTAVIHQVVGKNKYVVLHQNVGDRSKTQEQKQVVQKEPLDLSRRIEGTVWIYRPLEK